MGDNVTGQVSAAAAKIYDEIYLPALFDEWCPRVAQAAEIQRQDSVIDIACGTGPLAMIAVERVGPEGSVVAIDINRGMLQIARAKSSFVHWLEAPAEAIPVDDNRFDRVVSQFGLMYFEDPLAAVREMARVLKPGGSLAVAVWNGLDSNPGLAAEGRLWQKVFGEEIDETPFGLGDRTRLEDLFNSSDLRDVCVKTRSGTARFDSIESWIHTGAKGWTEDDALTDDELTLLLDTAENELTRFQSDQGTVSFPTSAHIVTASK